MIKKIVVTFVLIAVSGSLLCFTWAITRLASVIEEVAVSQALRNY